MSLHFISAENIRKPLQGILDSLVDLHISHRLVDDFLILCPDNICSEDLQNQLLQNPKLGSVLTGQSILSLKRYIEKYCDELWPQSRKAPSHILESLLKSILAKNLSAPYSKLSSESLIQLLICFREEFFPSSALLQFLESFDPELARECLACFNEYQTQMDQQDYLKDFPWQLQEVLKNISEQKSEKLKNIRRIYYLGFTDFSPMLKIWLQTLNKAYPNIEQIILIQKPKGIDTQDYFTQELGEIPSELHEFKESNSPSPSLCEYAGIFDEASEIIHKIIHRIQEGQAASTIALFLPQNTFLKAYFEKQFFKLGLSSKSNILKELSQFSIIQETFRNSFSETWEATRYFLNEERKKLPNVSEKDAENLNALETWKENLEEILFYLEEYPFLEKYIPSPPTIAKKQIITSQERPHEGIQIRSLNRIGLQEFECVFIPQLSEEHIPKKPDRFFGFPLPHFDKKLSHQRSLFQHLLNAGKEIHLSYSKTGFQAEEKSASPLILDFKTEEQNKNANPLWISQHSDNISESLDVEIQRLEDIRYQYKHAAWIKNPNVLQKLRQWMEQKSFSASRLENYAQCPFTFYAQSLLGIDIEEEKSLEGDAREQGKWVHQVLENFFSKNIDLLKNAGTNPQLRENILNQVNQDIEELKNSFLKEKDWIHPTLFEDFSERVAKSTREILHNFWQQWDNKKEGPLLIPRFFEKDFGNQESLTFKKAALPPLKLRGRIDRIDVTEDEKAFVTWDYKTGELGQFSSDVKNFKKLQLPLYLLAASKMKELSNKEALASLALGLKEMTRNQGIARKDKAKLLGIHSRAGALLGEEEWENFWKDFEVKILEYFENIYQGDFRTRPDPCSEFCEYQTICRYHDRKKA